jgi:NOL1/NOP2/sun family putative RNA methylase
MNFEEHLEKYLSKAQIDDLLDSLNRDATHALIVNTNKIDDSFLLNKFPNLIPHPFVSHCYLFDNNEYQLGKHIYFEQGLYYIFEPCSSLIAHFLQPEKDDIILDCAAAPGGKAIHTAILKENEGIVVANEISRERALVLSSNVERMGLKNVIVTNCSLDDFSSYEESFDKIILDAPCSGSGMFRKDNKMKEDWTYQKVLSLAELQKELILKAYALLKPGGVLSYSTCSFSYEEDEETVQYLLDNTDATLISLPESPSFFQSKSKIGIHLLPNLFLGEGHYLCLIKKPGTLTKTSIKNPKEDKYSNVLKKELNLEGYIYNFDNIYYLLPHYFDFKKLKVLRGGLKIGTLEKYGFDFDHALSHYLVSYSNSVELNKEDVTKYVQGNMMNLDVQDGYVIINYDGNGLGLGKAKNKKVNNKYPKGLRKNQILL